VPFAAQTGDVFCFFDDWKLPFVLRSCEEGYRLVGDAYLHGLMYDPFVVTCIRKQEVIIVWNETEKVAIIALGIDGISWRRLNLSSVLKVYTTNRLYYIHSFYHFMQFISMHLLVPVIFFSCRLSQRLGGCDHQKF
jgi:hypothetical protein